MGFMRVFRSVFAFITILATSLAANNSGAVTLTPLWQFSGTDDGSIPEAPLVQGSDSNLYGTTSSGTVDRLGTVFKITPSGVLTTLYAFTGASDGGAPATGLIQGSDSNFYGTTTFVGSNDVGTLFKMTS